MGIPRWVGERANEPLVAGGVFGTVALAFTAAYVTFVESARHGIFVISALLVVVAGTAATAVAGAFVWRYFVSGRDPTSYRTYAVAGFAVGLISLFLAPPLSMVLWTGGGVLDVFQTSGLLAPIIVMGWLLSVFAWGLVGTAIAIVVTAGVPMVLTTATGVGLGYLQRRYPDGRSITGEEPVPPSEN